MTSRAVVGVLALQGGVAEHARAVEASGGEVVLVKSERHLTGPDGLRLDALILPGGESSTIDRLLRLFDLCEPLKLSITAGLPTFGTCAGMILLAQTINDPAPGQQSLGVLDIAVSRNAFGPQIASAESLFDVDATDVHGDGPGSAVRGALIRAPEVTNVGPGARVITQWDGRVLGVTSGSDSSLGTITAIAYHPELTGDFAFHRALVDRAHVHHIAA